ncbi:hypothetical protein M413DRAFT_164365 [Hebeloma cylindrosporum]|uniref:Uncharacterized protein n=1 Tax=Hebeloma cylindrosporum TaxID=76867 RepID=A0A0C3BVC8_HEBCY|nr:hypothetical protein M413DRAFT_164365 [Hebeloma cylindrosporum h7]
MHSIQWNDIDDGYESTDEECSLRPLKVLQPQWNDLDTLTLSGMADSGNFMGMPPDVFSQISSLTVNFCSGLNFIPLMPHASSTYAYWRTTLVTYLSMQSITILIFLEFWKFSKSKAQVAMTFHGKNLREFRFAVGSSEAWTPTWHRTFHPPSRS